MAWLSHMRVLFLALTTLTFAVPASQAADLCLDLKFQCNGFEPNWQFVTTVDSTGRKVVSFLDPENPDFATDPLVVASCLLQGSPNDFEVTTDAPLSLVANIVGQSCTEPSGDLTNFSVTVTYNQGAQTLDPRRVEGTGCCKLLP